MRVSALAALFSVVAAQPSVAPAPTAPPIKLLDYCFDMGSKPGSDYVIKNGQRAEEGSVLADTEETFLFAWISLPIAPHTCTENHKWSVKEVAFPKNGILAEVVQFGEGCAKPLTGDNITECGLSILWDCGEMTAVDENFDGRLNITLEFEAHADITFSMQKLCIPYVPEDTWSPGAIFFFTCFILTLVFCILGCGFNYVQKGKTGLEIIPGATTCVGCVGKLVSQPRYTPQMDYDQPVDNGAQGGRYGASYQTDL